MGLGQRWPGWQLGRDPGRDQCSPLQCKCSVQQLGKRPGALSGQSVAGVLPGSCFTGEAGRTEDPLSIVPGLLTAPWELGAGTQGTGVN